jgi:hypothetical protein
MITRNLRLLTFHGDQHALFHGERKDEMLQGLMVILVDDQGTRLELPLRSWEEVDAYHAAITASGEANTIALKIG